MRRFRIPLTAQLVIALVLGCLVGVLGGPHVSFLGGIGTLIIKLLKSLAAPLVFFAIVDAFCKAKIKPLQGIKLISLSTMNAAVALVIAIGISDLLPIRRWVDFASLQAAAGISAVGAGAMAVPGPMAVPAALKLPELSLKALLDSVIPGNILEPFISSNVIGIVFLSLLTGIAVRALRGTNAFPWIEKFFAGGFAILSKALGLVVYVVPLAAFAIVAKVVGASGLKIFAALGVFVFIVTLGLFIHVALYYSLLLAALARKSPRVFFKQGGEALVTAFSTGSSLATLPVTLRTLQEKMKISPASSRLAACVGTNLNHDGILLYEAVAAFFIALLQGIQLTLHQKVAIALTSLLAAVGIAGVPDAGFITLSLVVGSVGLPLAAVPLLLPVDWFIGRLRATTNVCSDMIVATLLDQ